MQIVEYHFNCNFTSEAKLPTFKGSMLRGAFGHALKKVSCALGRQQCGSCLLAGTCVYSFIFETSKYLPENQIKQVRTSSIPHPYVLQPPAESRSFYQMGDDFTFNLILFGKGNEYLPHIVYAVENMGQKGLGFRQKATLGQFKLLSIQSGLNTVYDGASKTLINSSAQKVLNMESFEEEPVNTIQVRLTTPLRLKHQNKFQDTLPFHVLIRSALRRISTLSESYGEGEPKLDYPGLIKRATQVKIIHSSCRWTELKRYSNRQKTGMLMGGLQGAITYQGDLTEFLPILKFCQKTHLGKQTAFGLGRIEVVVGSPD